MPNREHARSELNLRDDEDVVLFMGAINPYKGITDLIEAVSIARRDRPRLRLIIAGNPQDSFEPYRAQIQRLDLTKWFYCLSKIRFWEVQGHPLCRSRCNGFAAPGCLTERDGCWRHWLRVSRLS